MKNKTALAELIDSIDKSEILDTFTKRMFIAFCVNQLPKEKQDLIDFGNKMQMVSDVDFDGNITFMFNAEEYFNENLEQ